MANHIKLLVAARESYLKTATLCEQAERYRSLAEMATRKNLAQTGGKVDEYVVKLMDVHEELNHKVQEMVDSTKEAETAIKTLKDERYKAVLSLYYLCAMDMDEVATKLHYSKRWVYKLHKEALKTLEAA